MVGGKQREKNTSVIIILVKRLNGYTLVMGKFRLEIQEVSNQTTEVLEGPSEQDAGNKEYSVSRLNLQKVYEWNGMVR